MYSPFIDLLDWIIWCLLFCLLLMFFLLCFQLGGLIHYERAAQNIISTTGYMPSETALTHYHNGRLVRVPTSKIRQEKPTANEINSLHDTNSENYNNIMKRQAIYRLNVLAMSTHYDFTSIPYMQPHTITSYEHNRNGSIKTKTISKRRRNGSHFRVVIPVTKQRTLYTHVSNPHSIYGFGMRIPFSIQINIPFDRVPLQDHEYRHQRMPHYTLASEYARKQVGLRATESVEATSRVRNDLTTN